MMSPLLWSKQEEVGGWADVCVINGLEGATAGPGPFAFGG